MKIEGALIARLSVNGWRTARTRAVERRDRYSAVESETSLSFVQAYFLRRFSHYRRFDCVALFVESRVTSGRARRVAVLYSEKRASFTREVNKIIKLSLIAAELASLPALSLIRNRYGHRPRGVEHPCVGIDFSLDTRKEAARGSLIARLILSPVTVPII